MSNRKKRGKEDIKYPNFNDMSNEEKLGVISMRLASLENAFGLFIKYNKCEDGFGKFYQKEVEAQKNEFERRKKELEEIKAKEEEEKTNKS